MRKAFDLAAHQGSRVHNCGLCGVQYYESLLRACPERGGRKACAYCCRLCRHSYRDAAGQGCRVLDAARKKKKTKSA